MPNILITGSRTLHDEHTLGSVMNHMIARKWDAHFIFGDAKTGADALALRIAQDGRLSYEVYEANWTKHGKKAGIIRNLDMLAPANEISQVWAWWDGESRGTLHTITTAAKMGIPVSIFGRKLDA